MQRIGRYIVLWMMSLWPLWGYATDLFPVEKVFVPTLQQIDPHKLIIEFKIKEGYRIYLNSLHIRLNEVELPFKFVEPQDKSFELSSLKIGSNQLNVYLTSKTKPFLAQDTIDIQWQGCSMQGVCYLPQITRFTISTGRGITRPQHMFVEENTVPLNWAKQKASTEFSGSIWQSLLFFYCAGLLLAFTACMYPLIPIVSSLIVGQASSCRRSFLLSLIYVEAMAIVYALLGGMAAWSGESLSVYLQNHWVLLLFAGFFFVMALAMFGLFQFQLPTRWQSWLVMRTQTLPKGGYASAAVLGSVSALLIGPCVAPPLVAALAYISQEGNIVLGMSSLYMIAMGIGTPLLVIGLLGQKLLPRLQPKLMTGIQRFFGFILLGVALWIVRPIVGYEGWFLIGGVWLGMIGLSCYRTRKVVSGIRTRGLITLIAACFMGLGLLAIVGAIVGEQKMVQSVEKLTQQNFAKPNLAWIPIHSLSSLKEILLVHKGKKILINFTADWCIACKEMSYLTLTDSKVRAALEDWVALQVDLTHQTADKQLLLKAFGLWGPPSWIFFDRKGEILPTQIVGYQNVEEFLQKLRVVEGEVK